MPLPLTLVGPLKVHPGGREHFCFWLREGRRDSLLMAFLFLLKKPRVPPQFFNRFPLLF